MPGDGLWAQCCELTALALAAAETQAELDALRESLRVANGAVSGRDAEVAALSSQVAQLQTAALAAAKRQRARLSRGGGAT